MIYQLIIQQQISIFMIAQNEKITQITKQSLKWKPDYINRDYDSRYIKSTNRPHIYKKIAIKLSDDQKQEVKYLFSEKNIYKKIQGAKYNQFKMQTFVEQTGQQIANIWIELGYYLFHLRLLNKQSQYNLNWQVKNCGGGGEILMYQHFDQEMMLKRIQHSFKDVRKIRNKIQKLKQTHRKCCIKEQRQLKDASIVEKKFIKKKEKIRLAKIQLLQKDHENLDKKFTQQINGAIKQYCILKFCSALRVGPFVPEKKFDILLFDDCICFIMEKCQSNLLSKYLPDTLSKDLADNLEKMHCFQLLHSDIKPSNILYSYKYQKYVFADYGLSNFVNYQAGWKQIVHNYRGTPSYSSPQMYKTLFEPNWVDLYDNDWFGLEKTITYVAEKKTNIKHTNPQNNNIVNQLPAWERLLKRIKTSKSQRQKRINELKLKILLKDFEYLQTNKKLLKYFAREISLFLQEIKIKLSLKQMLFFAYSLCFIDKSQIQQNCLIIERGNQHICFEDISKCHLIKQKVKSFTHISFFLKIYEQLYNSSSPSIQIQILQQFIPVLIQHLKTQKNSEQAKKIEQQIQRKIKAQQNIKIFKQVDLKKGIEFCFDLILDHIKDLHSEQSKQQILGEIIKLSLTSSIKLEKLFKKIIKRLLSQFQLDFFVKVELSFYLKFNQILHSPEYLSLVANQFNYYDKKNLKETQKFIIQQLENILDCMLKLKLSMVKLSSYTVNKKLMTGTHQFLQQQQKFITIIKRLFSNKFFVFKLYRCVLLIKGFCKALPLIKQYLCKLTNQTYGEAKVHQLSPYFSFILFDEVPQASIRLPPLSITSNILLQLQKGYSLFPQAYEEKISSIFQILYPFICQSNKKMLTSQVNYRLLNLIIRILEDKLCSNLKWQLIIQLGAMLILFQRRNPMVKDNQKWKPFHRMIEIIQSKIEQEGKMKQLLTNIYDYQYRNSRRQRFCFEKLFHHLQAEKKTAFIKCSNIMIDILWNKQRYDDMLKQWCQFESFIKPLKEKIGNKYKQYPFYYSQSSLLLFIAKNMPQQFFHYAKQIFKHQTQSWSEKGQCQRSNFIVIVTKIRQILYLQAHNSFLKNIHSKLTWQFYEKNYQFSFMFFTLDLSIRSKLRIEPSSYYQRRNILAKMCIISQFTFWRNIFYCFLLKYFIDLHQYQNLRKFKSHLKKWIHAAIKIHGELLLSKKQLKQSLFSKIKLKNNFCKMVQKKEIKYIKEVKRKRRGIQNK